MNVLLLWSCIAIPVGGLFVALALSKRGGDYVRPWASNEIALATIVWPLVLVVWLGLGIANLSRRFQQWRHTAPRHWYRPPPQATIVE